MKILLHKRFFIVLIISIMGIRLLSQTTITLQPNADNGKDAVVASINPNTNYGNNQNIEGEAWTYGGTPGATRSFFNFDFSQLPQGITVTNAFLSLYYAPQHDGDSHSTMSGSNNCLIQRIVSDWNESTVTWNNCPSTTSINQVKILQSTSSTQDYPNINVTSLVQDMIDEPSYSFGFMLKLSTEQYYRRMVFASSDYSDSTLHPKLNITFIEDTIQDTCVVFDTYSVEIKDAVVESNNPNTNYGNHQNIESEAWTYGGTPGSTRSYFDFDFSQLPLPQGITITNALLSLFYAPQSDGDGHSTLSGSNNCLIQRIVSDWNESTVTWNNCPSTTSINQVEILQSTSSTQDYPNINVTSLVQDMIDDPSNSFGFMLRLSTIEYYRRMVFASSNYIDSTLHPKLEICYLINNNINNSNDIKNEIIIFPNPTSGIIKINSNGITIRKIEVYNLLGSQIRSYNDDSIDFINISDLKSGVYLIIIYDTKGIPIKFEKIIKN